MQSVFIWPCRTILRSLCIYRLAPHDKAQPLPEYEDRPISSVCVCVCVCVCGVRLQGRTASSQESQASRPKHRRGSTGNSSRHLIGTPTPAMVQCAGCLAQQHSFLRAAIFFGRACCLVYPFQAPSPVSLMPQARSAEP